MTLIVTVFTMIACLATYALVAAMIGGRLGDLLLALSGTPRRSYREAAPAQTLRRASFA